MLKLYLTAFVLVFLVLNTFAAEETQSSDEENVEKVVEDGPDPEINDEYDLDKEQDPEIEYQKGSLCGYCSYCKVLYFDF